LVIPSEFRETLAIKEGDNVLLSLDSDSNTIAICPIYGDQDDLVKIEVVFGDTPGGLAAIAKRLAEKKVDLIMSESKSSQRRKEARWSVIGDISDMNISTNELKKTIRDLDFVESVSIDRISRDVVHS
jgi:bifunctional DNA-binding transcriptional regulator/antitoxin component of YhaV-PrlF toxin-antitoxin module